jgi:hypothetical protein
LWLIFVTPCDIAACTDAETQRGAEMECEQSLLMARRDEMPYEPASYYRWKAARARQLVDGITTQALKRRLLEEAMHYDELATAADRIAADAAFLT